MQNLALRAARALGVTGAVRVDLLVTAGENEYVLEVNTLPGMTQTSLLPKIAASAGYDFATLCEAIVASAGLNQPSRRKPSVREARQAIPTVTELRPARAAHLRAVGT